MSHNSNTELLELAGEIMEEFTGTWIERRLAELVADKDLEEIKRFIDRFGGELSQEHFAREWADVC